MFVLKHQPEKSTRVTVSLAEFDRLPEGSKLLVAYCLDRKEPSIEVLEWDLDVAPLVRLGWLVKEDCNIKAVCKYHFHSAAWRKLISLWSDIRRNVPIARIEDYRQRKSLLYPWRW
jgi:hypothetical protein